MWMICTYEKLFSPYCGQQPGCPPRPTCVVLTLLWRIARVSSQTPRCVVLTLLWTIARVSTQTHVWCSHLTVDNSQGVHPDPPPAVFKLYCMMKQHPV